LKLTLVSHKLCPYVQRVAIVLHEKGAPFERRWVDLADKPAWFRAISPLGKTPVLLAHDVPLFESAVICEYLDEVLGPRLHPDDPLERARHRGWMAFGSGILDAIAAFYNAPDARAFDARRDQLCASFAQIEQVLAPAGPWFEGDRFSMVDAVFAPVFRYFEVFDALGVGGFFAGLPRLRAWRDALAQRESARRAATDDYAQLLAGFVGARGSELSRRVAALA
jgi:glutathione S-transferase